MPRVAGDGAAVRPSYERLEALVVAQAAVIEQLQARVAEQAVEIAELKARLAQNSRNSSRPPSSDGYAKPPATRSLRRASGLRPGGQVGHAGHHLERVESADEVVWRVPERCDDCGGDLVGAEVVGQEARQVFELPPVRLVVCEHRAQRRRCGCGHVTTAAFPAGVGAPAQYGPRVRALAIYLTAYQHLPYDRAAQLLSDWLGAPVSTGTLAAIVSRGAADLDGFVGVVREQLIAAPVCHFDETGARVAGRLRWLHSASTEQLTLYGLHDRRGVAGIDRAGVLPAFAGVAVHDGWGPYRRYEQVTHALCNAHHLRELQGVIEQHPDRQSWAVRMDTLLRELRDTVQAAKAAGATRLDDELLQSFVARYDHIIAAGHQQNPPPTRRTTRRGPIARSAPANLLGRLDQHRDDVLRFAHNLAVPFDNNLAERDIRMVKLQQKISGCWRTVTGAQGFFRIRAYISTARKHGHHILDALTRLADHDPWLPAAAEP